MRTLIWFRSDLRTTDNTALAAAAKQAKDTASDDNEHQGVLAVFTICPDQWAKEHDWATIKSDFILRTLRTLAEDLQSLGIPLRIINKDRFQQIPAALLKLAKHHKCGSVHFNREYEWNERQRDEAVIEHFENAGLQAHPHTDQSLWEPGRIRTGSDTYYTVFSPFKKACYKRWKDGDRPESPSLPRSFPAANLNTDDIPESVKHFRPNDDERSRWADLYPAGQKSARAKLAAFVKNNISDYNDTRDLPAEPGTSGLSPYLTVGAISCRQCLSAALKAANNSIDKGPDGPAAWIDEIIWREFYKHLIVGHPRVSKHRPFQTDTESITWNDDDDAFAAWCEGRTGFPIVDAAMRQLNTIGWMHNRLRMITAMFLTKDLFIDWRKGERYFMQRLIDGDLASNNGGWQWSASTGTDAAPYFRIMNPITQSHRYDKDARFIKEWLPELAHLPAKAAHDPHAADPKSKPRAHAEDSLFESLNYPEPIADHKEAREHAINTFKALKKS